MYPQPQQQASSGAGRCPEALLWDHLGQHHSFLLEKRFIAFMGNSLAVPEHDPVFCMTEVSMTLNTANLRWNS